MVGSSFAAPEVFFLILMASSTSDRLNAQTCLTLSPGRVKPGNTALLDLSLNTVSGEHPVAIQWTFQYPPASIGSVTVDDGPALKSTGKTVFCAGNAAAYRCLIAGANPNEIPDGVVARVTAKFTSSTRTATISIDHPLAASADGYPLPVRSKSGTITVVNGFAQRQPDPPSGPAAGKGPCSAEMHQEKDK
jgi:hypothetical protein